MKECGGKIENVLDKIEQENLRGKKKQKYIIPADFNYKGARTMFLTPEVKEATTFNVNSLHTHILASMGKSTRRGTVELPC
jgi:hypothetical protein